MSETLDRKPTVQLSALPGAPILLRLRKLLWMALGAGVLYSFLTTGGKSACAGGYAGDGGYLDANWQPTELAPQCISLTLQPSFLVQVTIAVIVLAAISRVLKRAVTEGDAFRIIDRAGILIFVIAIASILISQVWFGLIPISDWDGSGTLWFPFPFGSVTMETYPADQR